MRSLFGLYSESGGERAAEKQQAQVHRLCERRRMACGPRVYRGRGGEEAGKQGLNKANLEQQLHCLCVYSAETDAPSDGYNIEMGCPVFSSGAVGGDGHCGATIGNKSIRGMCKSMYHKGP